MPVVPKHASLSLKSRIVTAVAPACVAGADIASQAIFVAPANIVISKATIVGRAASVGIDAANTSVWILQTRLAGVETTLHSVTFNNVLAFPAAFTPYALGVALGTGFRIPRDTLLCFTVTNGVTAATPETLVQIEYWINEDV